MASQNDQLLALKKAFIDSGKKDAASTKTYQDSFKKLASSFQQPKIETPKIETPKIETPKLTGVDKINSQIDEATKAGNTGDVATLRGLLNKQSETPVQNTSQIDSLTQQTDSATKSLVAQLKQRIADDIASQQGVIAKAPQTFDPLRATSEVNKSQQLRSALERSSVLGDRGGVGRSEALATQTEGDNRLNAINLQQQNVISDAEATIASLEREGRYEEARIKADQTNQLLAAISNEQVRQEGITREDTIRQENRDLDATEQKKQDFINTITRFAQDYTAQINTVTNDGDPTNDWQIPLLETAKQDKIQTQGLDPNTGLPLPVDNTQDVYDLALKRWNGGLPLSAEEMQVLRVDTPTKSGASSGSTSGTTTNNIVTNQGFDVKAIARELKSLVDAKADKTDIDGNPVNPKQTVMDTIADNLDWFGDNDETLQATLDDNLISEDEFADYVEWRTRALNYKEFQ